MDKSSSLAVNDFCRIRAAFLTPFSRSLQIRSMGAIAICCMLEGPPQRAFLAVAEARTLSPPRGGFTTLSSSLGQVRGATKGHQINAEHHTSILVRHALSSCPCPVSCPLYPHATPS